MVLIGCRGGDKDAPGILKSEGWRYGLRSDYKPYSDDVYFIDIKWRSYNWSNHLALIRDLRPKIAMVADFENISQKSLMLSQVEDIWGVGVRPVVCPKFMGALGHIPNDCIVGVSVPTQYAGWLPDASHVFGRDIHFLGGHPDQVLFLSRKFAGAKFCSFDCSAIFEKAQYGAFWSAKQNTWRYPKYRYGASKFSTHNLTRISARNIGRYFNNPPRCFVKDRKRLKAVGFELQPDFFSGASHK